MANKGKWNGILIIAVVLLVCLSLFLWNELNQAEKENAEFDRILQFHFYVSVKDAITAWEQYEYNEYLVSVLGRLEGFSRMYSNGEWYDICYSLHRFTNYELYAKLSEQDIDACIAFLERLSNFENPPSDEELHSLAERLAGVISSQ